MTSRPKSAADLGPLFADPSAPLRDEPAGARPGAGARARAYTRTRADAQESAGMDVEVGARALAATLKRADERRADLAALVAAARSARVADEAIRAHLVLAGLPEGEISAALT